MATRLSRRSFLAAGASAAFVTACGGNGSSSSPTSAASSAPTTSGPRDFVLITFTDTSALVPGSPQRLAFSLADQEGVVIDAPPAPTLDFTVLFEGQPVGSTITAPSHQQGLPKPYYPIEFTPAKAGIYTVATTVNGKPFQSHVQIPESTQVLGTGVPMPALDTPTAANPLGQLLCTRSPVCPLHDVTLREALAGGQPVAFLISTPAYCRTAICGPVLDVLLEQKDQFPQIKMLHAEVYPSEADAQPGVQRVTDTVKAFHLTFEPVLYLVGPDGKVANRIDTIFDGVELHDALTQIAG